MSFNKAKYDKMHLDELNKVAAGMHATKESDRDELAYVNSLRKAMYLELEEKERQQSTRTQTQTITPNGLRSDNKIRQKGE